MPSDHAVVELVVCHYDAVNWLHHQGFLQFIPHGDRVFLLHTLRGPIVILDGSLRSVHFSLEVLRSPLPVSSFFLGGGVVG